MYFFDILNTKSWNILNKKLITIKFSFKRNFKNELKLTSIFKNQVLISEIIFKFLKVNLLKNNLFDNKGGDL
jgi:hypothetical protein